MPSLADEQESAMPSRTISPHPHRYITIIALWPLLAAEVALTQPRYEVTDLGEFSPTDVNEQGEVIGRVAEADPRSIKTAQ
jgi:hypothetical protein